MNNESLLRLLNSAPTELAERVQLNSELNANPENGVQRARRLVHFSRIEEKLQYEPGQPEITPRRIRSPGTYRNYTYGEQEAIDETQIGFARIIKYCELQFREPKSNRNAVAVRHALLDRLQQIMGITPKEHAAHIKEIVPTIIIPIGETHLSFNLFSREATYNGTTANLTESEAIILYQLLIGKYVNEPRSESELLKLLHSDAQKPHTIQTQFINLREKLPGLPVIKEGKNYSFIADLTEEGEDSLEKMIEAEVKCTFGQDYIMFVDLINWKVTLNNTVYDVTDFIARTLYLLAHNNNKESNPPHIVTYPEIIEALPKNGRTRSKVKRETDKWSGIRDIIRRIQTQIPQIPLLKYPGQGYRLSNQLPTITQEF